MDDLRDLAARLEGASGTLSDLARRLPYAGPAASAFTVDAPGLPGEVGRALHAQWLAALDNRARELAAAAEQLADGAAAVRAADQAYADSDDGAAGRLARER
ncbi:hypothetical protein [Plantactinospora sp. CA-290183]|uniref:hypothetical protein n=1 Tax=Plantactinospora sp. CA-290183 TaxID=3240006 RepID=UPI003D8ABD86